MIGLAGGEGVAEVLDVFGGDFSGPDQVNDFSEVTPNERFDAFEVGHGHGVDLLESELRVHDIDANGGLIDDAGEEGLAAEEGCFSLFAGGDVADVALDDVVTAFIIEVGDDFDFLMMTTGVSKGQVLVADFVIGLEFGEGRSAEGFVFGEADFEEFLADELVFGIAQQ